jgi:hypothetical protein
VRDHDGSVQRLGQHRLVHDHGVGRGTDDRLHTADPEPRDARRHSDAMHPGERTVDRTRIDDLVHGHHQRRPETAEARDQAGYRRRTSVEEQLVLQVHDPGPGANGRGASARERERAARERSQHADPAVDAPRRLTGKVVGDHHDARPLCIESAREVGRVRGDPAPAGMERAVRRVRADERDVRRWHGGPPAGR